MEAVIINRKESTLDEKVSRRLLWFAVMLFDKINFITQDSLLFDIEGMIQLMTPEEKFRIVRANAPAVGPDQTPEKYVKMYFEYTKLKKIKHKDRNTLLYFMNLEHFIKGIETGFRNLMNSIAETENLQTLIELNNSKDGNFINLKLPCPGSAKQSIYNTPEESLSRIINRNMAIPVFDLSIKNSPFYKEEPNTDIYDGSLIIFDDPILTISSPEKLTYGELKQMRSESLKATNQLITGLEFSSEKEVHTQEEEEALQKNKILVDAMNEVLAKEPLPEDRPVFGKSMNPDSQQPEKTFEVFSGICSKDTLLKIYRQSNLISEDCEAYVKSQLTGPDVLRTACPLIAINLN